MSATITPTAAARAIIDQLQEQYGALMFHLGGGCCGGNAPLCLEAGELMTDATDVHLGTVHGCAFWMTTEQLATRQGRALQLDVVETRGAGFSLEIPLNVRFLLRTLPVGMDLEEPT